MKASPLASSSLSFPKTTPSLDQDSAKVQKNTYDAKTTEHLLLVLQIMKRNYAVSAGHPTYHLSECSPHYAHTLSSYAVLVLKKAKLHVKRSFFTSKDFILKLDSLKQLSWLLISAKFMTVLHVSPNPFCLRNAFERA